MPLWKASFDTVNEFSDVTGRRIKGATGVGFAAFIDVVGEMNGDGVEALLTHEMSHLEKEGIEMVLRWI
ncbi:MAG: hypothetical protein VX278_10345 [Myxococcota bacterium]|nr:hypothetical protein [Myxococcota bacterium]